MHISTSDDRLKPILDSDRPIAFALFDRDLCYLAVSQHWKQLFQVQVQDMVGQGHDDIVPNTPERLKDGFLRGLAGDAYFIDKAPYEAPDGTVNWLRWEVHPWMKDNEIAGIIVFAEDITSRQTAEEELQLAYAIYRGVSEAIMVADADNRVVAVNPAFTRITGYSEAEIIGQSPALLKSGMQDQTFYENFWDSLLNNGHWKGEIWNRRKNGDVYPEWLTINTLYGEEGKVWRRVALFSDITDKKSSAETIWRQANFDPLTKLPNRVLFLDRLQQAIFAADRNQTKVGVLFVDVDYFKQINDTYGHKAGDQVLLQIAERMHACVRSMDTVSRFAGDEFTLLLTDLSSTDDLSQIAVKIRETLAQPVIFKSLSLDISASIGGAIYPEDAENMDLLLQAADAAMYDAKKQGRNCFRLFSGDMGVVIIKRQQLESDLKQAIANDEFVLLYQPVIDLYTGTINSLESLLRWQHPRLGLLNPDSFLAVAKDSGLISAIDKLMLRKVCSQLREWKEKAYDANIRINLALRDFLSNDYFELFFELLEIGEIDPMMLSVEVEENILRSSMPQVLRKVNKLKESPINISIDNFGTDYASLVTLMHRGIDYVKIDRSYLRSDRANSKHFKIIQALIIAMAHSMNVKVVAAGVENKQQAEFLKKLGCDLVQGFFYYKPISSLEAEKLLSKTLDFQRT